MDESAQWGGTERRKSPRLRKIIDDLQAGVRENREAIASLSRSVFRLEEQIETRRRPSSAPR